MYYQIIEIQTTGNTSVVVTPIPSSVDQYEAESIFHQKMSYAAISSVPVHSVVLLNEKGCVLMNGSYNHTNSSQSD